MQNSGAIVEIKSMYFSSSKDKNHILTSRAFYGVIEDIWEIGYVIFKEPLFKYKWILNNNGVQIDDLRFTRIDFGKETYMIKAFIMTSQAKQFFYVIDHSNISGRCPIVLQGKYITRSDESFDIPSILSYTTQVPTSYDEVDRDDVRVICNDHKEDI